MRKVLNVSGKNINLSERIILNIFTKNTKYILKNIYILKNLYKIYSREVLVLAVWNLSTNCIYEKYYLCLDKLVGEKNDFLQMTKEKLTPCY